MHPNHKILLIILGFICTGLKGQDVHFSQYFNSPLTLSPAETGNFEGDWRASLNYRNQWKAITYPFRTFSAGYDQQLYIKKHHLSLGAYVLNDQSGVNLNCTKIYLSGAYHYKVNENVFTGGLQIGYVMKTVNYGKLLFPDDWTGSEWDVNHSTSESDNGQLYYPDLNLGLTWKRRMNSMEAEVGVAMFHLTQPKETFYGSPTDVRVPLRIAFQTGVKANLSPSLYVKPGVLVYSMRGSRNMMAGGQAGFATKGNRMNMKEIYAGLYLRNGIFDNTDAVMAMFGVQIRKFAINVSYDVNISSMRAYSNYRGAFEISLIYKSITTIVKTFTIPCERI